MKTTVEWISVDERLPHDGAAVCAAVTGRYPPDEYDPEPGEGLEFWLVLPMYFRTVHPVEETGEIVENCFVDPDYVVRLPFGGESDETVTHWTALPCLPGTDVHQILGEGVRPALHAVRS
ncbi:hypothetical protein SAMN05421835_105157 [Amycolatopsis sacchari]|uniref:Amine oxidase n=1 Tax=Amycolatopsis sacchari TaxID=115433 RepID=A0A1I3R6I8_9PSEU|nr:AQJ64_40280 family protein [Amycolatopsis sacchari]SFJ41735.1 hypothetical protein SAMN05421835_105157 [Amycolatopsis sacchari]